MIPLNQKYGVAKKNNHIKNRKSSVFNEMCLTKLCQCRKQNTQKNVLNKKNHNVTVSKLNNDETFLINPPPSFC